MSKKNKTRPDDVSLRDYFAGLSLQALIYAAEDDVENIEGLKSRAPFYAQRAYLLADAMLVARTPADEEEPA